MITVHTLKTDILERCAVTIGKFDGLHRGHRALIAETVRAARAAGIPAVVLSLETSADGILTGKEKNAFLEELHVDVHISCPLTRDIIAMEPEAFAGRILRGRLGAEHVVVGEDFRFGYGRRGNTAMLFGLGSGLGFSVACVPEVTIGGEKISSSVIRALLKEGKVDTAAEMLGYPYFLTGEVVHGRAVGRTIGVPTANIIPGNDKFLPAYGVYLTRTVIGNRACFGITNIGVKPTVEGSFPGAETYLFDVDEDLYGMYEKMELLRFVRKERRFASLEELRIRLSADMEEGRRLAAEAGGVLPGSP